MLKLVQYDTAYEAPHAVVRGLRAIRPNAELLYQGKGVWMLGEVRWNWERHRRGCAILRHFWLSKKEVGAEWMTDPRAMAFLREGQLMIQGFVWIADYSGEPNGRIVEDYRRKCWKEDHGMLDGEYYQMADESSDKTSLLRRTKILTDRVTSEGRSDFNIIMKKRKSFTQRIQLAANRAKASLLPQPTSRIIQ